MRYNARLAQKKIRVLPVLWGILRFNLPACGSEEGARKRRYVIGFSGEVTQAVSAVDYLDKNQN